MKGKCKINAFSHSQETLLNEKSLIEFAPLPYLEICALKPANFHLWLPIPKHYEDTLNDALDASNWTLTEMVYECFFMFPLESLPLRGTQSRVRKFLLARLSADSELFCFLPWLLARLRTKLVTNFAFPPWLSLPPPLAEDGGEQKKYQSWFRNVSSLTSTHSSPTMILSASLRAFPLAASSLISSPDKLLEGCPEMVTKSSQASENGSRPLFWSM